jgi:hypothetical protein
MEYLKVSAKPVAVAPLQRDGVAVETPPRITAVTRYIQPLMRMAKGRAKRRTGRWV